MPCFGSFPKINLNLDLKSHKNHFSMKKLRKSLCKKISFSMESTDRSEYKRHQRCIEKLKNEQCRRQKQLCDLKRAATSSRPSSDNINPDCTPPYNRANTCIQVTSATCDQPSCPALTPYPCTDQTVCTPSPCMEQPVCTPLPCMEPPVCTHSPCMKQPECTPYSCTERPACRPYPCKEKPVCTLYPCREQPPCTTYPCPEQPVCTPYPCMEQPACTLYPRREQPVCSPYSCKEHPACTAYPCTEQCVATPYSCIEQPACPPNPCTQPKCAPSSYMHQSTCTLPSCPSRTTSICKASKISMKKFKLKKRRSSSCRVTPTRSGQSISPDCGSPCKEQSVGAPCPYMDQSTCTLPSCPSRTPSCKVPKRKRRSSSKRVTPTRSCESISPDCNYPSRKQSACTLSPCDSRTSISKGSKKKRKTSRSCESMCSECGGPMCTGREDCCCSDCIKWKPPKKYRRPRKRSCSKDKRRRCCKCRRRKRRKLKRWRRRRCRQPRNLCFRCFICCILFGTVVACILTFIPIFAGTQ
ncbi:keratin-associated protein 10-7-like [Cydia pomonella]|uniref:keratin-associated protein 10-7-like n=1 Tax=Cydia pomonella TaxID=82600 RepID=UPI002ADD8462|nr:keratin-associated protein 10-7-like [Cydia pomonella]